MSFELHDQPQSTAPKPFVLVLMPFADAFKDVYQIGIKEACIAAGAHCERVDEQLFDGSILDRVFNQIAKADTIVADMTGRNPNVFYEVGYAHALDKRTILLTRDAEDIPFDLKHFSHIVYGSSLVGLRAELTARVRWAISAAGGLKDQAPSPLAYYMAGIRLRDGSAISLTFSMTPSPEALSSGTLFPKFLAIKIDIENTSRQSYDASRVQIGLSMPRRIAAAISGQNIIAISADESLVTLGNLGVFMPLSWQSVLFSLPIRNLIHLSGSSHVIRLQTFDDLGNGEIIFNLSFVQG
jgi:hypothetical protein